MLKKIISVFFRALLFKDEIVPIHSKFDCPGLVWNYLVNPDSDGQEDVFNGHEEKNPVPSRVVGEKGLENGMMGDIE